MLTGKIAGLEQKLDDIHQLLFSLLNNKAEGIGDWLTLESTKKLTGLGRTKLYELRKAGILSESSLTGKEVFIRKSSIESALNNKETELQDVPLIKSRARQK
jgi:hypothetical protein